jgi:hypothetical protein
VSPESKDVTFFAAKPSLRTARDATTERWPVGSHTGIALHTLERAGFLSYSIGNLFVSL